MLLLALRKYQHLLARVLSADLAFAELALAGFVCYPTLLDVLDRRAVVVVFE